MAVALSSGALPSARVYPFIASADKLVYLWGGRGDTEPGTVFLFQRDTKTWARQRTKGQHPPTGLHNGGCCISGQHLYIYGGWDKKSYSGVLYELNTDSWTWRKLSEDGAAEGPWKKRGCKMIPYQDQLIVVGGFFKEMPTKEMPTKQAGSSYENRKTNEVHSFSLTTGLWSSPLMKGSRPPLRDRFSLIVTDEDQAVMFGGRTLSDESSEAHVLHLPTMTWTKHKEGDPWPKARNNHIAACLGYGGHHKTVLISGGWGGSFLDDMWLLDLQSGRMEELQVPEKYQELIKRCGHGAATLTVNSDCVDVILFGGRDKDKEPMAETTILRFMRQASAPEGVSPAQRWILTAVDEIKKKQDASDKSASESFKAADLSTSHGDTGGTKEDDDKDIMMTEEIESELLKEYPQLPVVLQNEDNSTITHSGFSTEKEISVTYIGQKSSIIWKEGGILMKLDEDKDHGIHDATKFSIQKFNSEGSYSRLPSNSEVASQVYFINSSKQIKRTATIRIYHQAREVDIDKLSFLTSTDEQPPYDFNILKGGHFTSAYGEITVERFSFFTLCHLVKQHGFRGVLYYMEKSYEASLYHSKQPLSQGSKFKWNLYLSVTKNCQVFRSCLKAYIKKEYDDDVKLVDKCIVKLNRAVDSITVSTSLGTSPPSQDEVYLREAATTSLKKSKVEDYTDGCPPAFNYRLFAIPDSKFKIEFDMEGFEETCKFNLHMDDLQELCSCTSSQMPSSSNLSSDNAEYSAVLFLQPKNSTRIPKHGCKCEPQHPVFSCYISPMGVYIDLKCGTIMRLFRNKFPASDAKKLGTYLDISCAKLQELKQNNFSDSEGFLIDTINYWLENDTEKSWSKLAEAVENCGHKLLAEEARSMESVSPCAK